MKPNPSPLNIIDVSLTKFEYNFVMAETSDEVKLAFEKYELDLDFSVLDREYIQVRIKADINNGKKKLPGYSIAAEVVCFFEFDESIVISEESRKAIGGFSTIYIALNNLRSMIAHITASAPFGRYLLPSIDLNNLIEQKKKALLNNHLNKKRTHRKKKMEQKE